MLGRTEFSQSENPIQGIVYPDGTARDIAEIAAVMDIAREDTAKAFPEHTPSAVIPPVLPVPVRGYISGRPATRWEEGHISGNGTMGAFVIGLPLDEMIILTHEKLFLAWEKPIPPVNTTSHLKEIRGMLSAGQYQRAADIVVELAKKEGYGPK